MVKKVQFDNGIRLICEEIPHVESVSIGVWQDIGSSFETKDNNGYTHFIEHMLFKGANGLSAYEIARKIDSVGGIMNAFTTRERTCFYSNVVSKHTIMVLELLLKMYYESDFNPIEIEREKQVILQEVKMYEDTPEELIHDKFIELLWPNDSIGLPIIGTQKTIKKLDRDKILKFFNNNYSTDNLVIAITGKFNYQEIYDIVKNCRARKSDNKIELSNEYIEPEYRNSFIEKKLEQVHLIMGMPGITRADPRRYALYLLNLIIGGSMSSRIYQSIREEAGMCYSIYSFTSLFRRNGFFGIYCGTSLKYLEKVFQLLKIEFDKIKRNGIKDEELFHAKEQMKGNILLGKENIEARMNRLAVQELSFGKHQNIHELIKKIEKVTMDDIKEMIEHILKDGKISISTLGNGKHIPILKKILPW